MEEEACIDQVSLFQSYDHPLSDPVPSEAQSVLDATHSSSQPGLHTCSVSLSLLVGGPESTFVHPNFVVGNSWSFLIFF